MKKIKPIGILIFASMALWVVLSGLTDPFHLTEGALGSILIVLFTYRVHSWLHDDLAELQLLRVPWFALWFPSQVVPSALKVSYTIYLASRGDSRALIKPKVYRIEIRLANDLARAFFGMCISLIPSTVTFLVDGFYLYVHALHPEFVKDIQKLADQVCRLFGHKPVTIVFREVDFARKENSIPRLADLLLAAAGIALVTIVMIPMIGQMTGQMMGVIDISLTYGLLNVIGAVMFAVLIMKKDLGLGNGRVARRAGYYGYNAIVALGWFQVVAFALGADSAQDVISIIFLVLGMAVFTVAGLGMSVFPCFFTKMHPVAMLAGVALGCMSVGFAVLSWDTSADLIASILQVLKIGLLTLVVMTFDPMAGCTAARAFWEKIAPDCRAELDKEVSDVG